MKYLDAWQTSVNEVSKLEEKYKIGLIKRYNLLFEEALIFLEKEFLKNEFDNIKKNETSIFGDYDIGRVKITFSYKAPIAENENHGFLTIIKDKNRTIYRIVIKPKQNIYIPTLSKSAFRPLPQSKEQADALIKKIQDEYIFLLEKEKELDIIPFKFSFCIDREDINSSMLEKLDKFDDFKSLSEKILSFKEIIL